jgi:hypothetical protein
MTSGQSVGASFASPVPTEEGHVPTALHADGAAVGFLDLREFVLQIAEALGSGGTGGGSGGPTRQRHTGPGDLPRDGLLTGETLLHPDTTLLAGYPVTAGLERDYVGEFGAEEALSARDFCREASCSSRYHTTSCT